jgi:hypothetical protein
VEELEMKLEVAHEVNTYINGEVEALVLRLMELDGQGVSSSGNPPAEAQASLTGAGGQASSTSRGPEDASQRMRGVEAANSAFSDFKAKLSELQGRAEAAEAQVAAMQTEYSAQV